MSVKSMILSFLLTTLLVSSAFGAEIKIFIKNNASATQISDIIILGRKNGGNGEWTTVWGGQKSSRNAKDVCFGYRELRKFVFKDAEFEEYQIRYTVKQGELNLVEDYWTGSLSNGSIFVMTSDNGVCSLEKKSAVVPSDAFLG